MRDTGQHNAVHGPLSGRPPAGDGLPARHGRFQPYWLAETLRLREVLWGPLDDASETRLACRSAGSFEDRLLWRAKALGRREQLDATLDSWSRMARLSLLVMALTALLAGAGAALGALGDGSRPVNVMLALAAMLGINMLTFVFWLGSFAWSSSTMGGSWLGECWLWLTRRLARGPNAALAPRALVELMGRHNVLRWALGSLSHGWWTLALSCAIATLLAILSARRYSFNWETTLLSPDAFVWLTSMLGWLPAHLGFAMPSDAMIRASDGLTNVPPAAQALWSSWLIGCIVVYGLAPRIIAFALSASVASARLRNIRLDPTLPGFAELRDRLDPASERAGVDDLPGANTTASVSPAAALSLQAGQAVLAGIELAPDVPWPPEDLPANIANLGVIDGGGQRKALLDRLAQSRPPRILMVCDARQTPDRGTVGLLVELAALTGELRILLAARGRTEGSNPDARIQAWLDRLQAAGFGNDHIVLSMRQGLQWLSGVQDAQPDGTSEHVAPRASASGSTATSGDDGGRQT